MDIFISSTYLIISNLIQSMKLDLKLIPKMHRQFQINLYLLLLLKSRKLMKIGILNYWLMLKVMLALNAQKNKFGFAPIVDISFLLNQHLKNARFAIMLKLISKLKLRTSNYKSYLKVCIFGCTLFYLLNEEQYLQKQRI